MEMQALIEEIGSLFQKITSGNASLGELEAFAAATSQLNERAIVLRYKAYEAKVYGNVSAPTLESEPAIQEEPTVLETTPLATIENEAMNETESFDLFSLDEEADEMSFALDMEETTEVEAAVETNSSVLAEEPEAIEVETTEPVVEEPEMQAEVHVVEENNEAVVQEPIAETSDTSELHTIYTKLNANDGSMAARLMSVRLETLKGAFGFNERLQIIQELFQGSNDAFSQLIEKLEETHSKEVARSLVSTYANQFDWDVENPLALELIQKVERKYA